MTNVPGYLYPTMVAASLAIVAQGVMYVRLAWKSIKDSERRRVKDEIQTKFVSDMAKNHLPHIYHALELMCRKLGIEIDDPPPIRWVDLNGKHD